MSDKKLKRTFILSFILLITLIIVASCDKNKVVNTGSEGSVNVPANIVNIDTAYRYDKLDYNNLSTEEMEYVSKQYGGMVSFTKRGVEVYYEGVSSGKLKKIITTSWPTDEIGLLIPEIEHENLERIEYTKDSIYVRIEDASKKDLNNYMDKLKAFGFTENKTKDDGKVMTKYDVYNEKGDLVTVKLMKENKRFEINAKKVN